MKKELREKKDLLLVVVCGVLVFWGMQNLEAIWNLLWEFLGILTPFIMGAFLAFVLNIPLKRAERLLKKNKWLAEHTGITRMLSILMAYAFVLAVVAFVLVLVIPELLDMMEALEVSIPDFVERTERAMQGLERTRPRTAGYFASLNLDWEQIMNTALDVLKNGVIDVVSSTWDIATMVINGAIDLVISLIFSFYILVQKEKLQAQFGVFLLCQRPVYRSLPVRAVDIPGHDVPWISQPADHRRLYRLLHAGADGRYLYRRGPGSVADYGQRAGRDAVVYSVYDYSYSGRRKPDLSEDCGTQGRPAGNVGDCGRIRRRQSVRPDGYAGVCSPWFCVISAAISRCK